MRAPMPAVPMKRVPPAPGVVEPVAGTGHAEGMIAWLPEAAGGNPESLHRLAAGSPRRLGELLVDVNPAIGPLVEEAVDEARRDGRKVGEALVDRGVITAAQRDTFLSFQRHQRGEAPTDERFRLGRLLVSKGHITDAQLEEALEGQRASGFPLGELLVANGWISAEVLKSALEMQRGLVTAALVAALTMASPGAITPAEAAQSATRSIDFAVRIPPVVRVKMLSQPSVLEVTEEDARRGYVDLDAASTMQVLSNTFWNVSFQAQGDVIRSARVRGLSGEITVGPDGSAQAGLLATRKAATFELSYRFDLRPGTRAGTYPWPIVVTVAGNMI